jgi:hypothetical protein
MKIAQQKYVIEQDRIHDLNFGTKLEDPLCQSNYETQVIRNEEYFILSNRHQPHSDCGTEQME